LPRHGGIKPIIFHEPEPVGNEEVSAKKLMQSSLGSHFSPKPSKLDSHANRQTMKDEARGMGQAKICELARREIRVIGVILTCLASMAAGSGAELTLAKEQARVEIAVQRSRSSRVKGGDWDDKLDKVSVEVKVRTMDLNRPIEGLVARYWVFAKAINDPKAFKVILQGDFPVNLTSAPAGREAIHQSKEATLRWDNTQITFGERYEGWLVVVLNAEGEVVASRSSKPSWEQNVAKAGNLKAGKYYTSNLDSTKAPFR
jgi:hypothetical protein